MPVRVGVRVASPRPYGPSRPIVHEWRRRVALAFCPETVEDADPARVALDARNRALRVSHRSCSGALALAFTCGGLSVRELSLRLSAEADRCVAEALAGALDFAAARLGPSPGRCGVLALGKLGSRELTLTSDLDLVFVYDCPDESGAEYFDRAAKAMVCSLYRGADSDPLYDVDMRLRPHGGDGPIAVPLSSLGAYYDGECWTWELQALTRARFVAGDAALWADMKPAILTSFASVAARTAVLDEVAAMRALMQAERPPKTDWDQKRSPGGLIDIEFIVQALQLQHADRLGDILGRRTDEALAALRQAGALSAGDARLLLGAYEAFSTAQHVQAAFGQEALDHLGGDLRRLLLKRVHASSIPTLRRRIGALRDLVRSRFEALVGPVEGDGEAVFAA